MILSPFAPESGALLLFAFYWFSLQSEYQKPEEKRNGYIF